MYIYAIYNTYIHIQLCIHTYTHTHTPTYVHTHIHLYTYMFHSKCLSLVYFKQQKIIQKDMYICRLICCTMLGVLYCHFIIIANFREHVDIQTNCSCVQPCKVTHYNVRLSTGKFPDPYNAAELQHAYSITAEDVR